jgi:GTP-binding protein EngB required for normal cell division
MHDRHDALTAELVGLSSGDPTYTSGKHPSQIQNRMLGVVQALLGELGIDVRIQSGLRSFDLGGSYRGAPVYVEVKFGRITLHDIQRVIAVARGVTVPGSRVILLGTEVPAELRNLHAVQENSIVLVSTFAQLAGLFDTTSMAARRQFLLRLASPVEEVTPRDVEEQQIVSYMRRVFGEEFWMSVSKSELSASLLRSVKGILGRSEATLVFVGTTHTGKSSIANALFGDDVVPTAVITDVTGAIARIHLQNGLTIIDTPGVGGMNERYERVTRSFLGLASTIKNSSTSSIPVVDIDSQKNRTLGMCSQLDYAKVPVVVILVFDLAGGFKRSDFEFLNEVRARCPSVVLAGNKRDLLDNENSIENIRLDLKKRAFVDFVAVAAKPKGGNRKPIALDSLVNAVCFQLSENAVATFNEMLVRQHQLSRNRLIQDAILRVAARASTVKPHQVVPEVGVPIHKVLLTGLVIRLGIDYEVGGSKVRGEVETAIRDTFASVLSKTTKKSTKVTPRTKQVRKLVTRAPGGAAAGLATGAILGAIGGPAGMLLGALLGAIFGGVVGASAPIAQLVMQMWNIPEDTIQEVPGGAEAAMATIAFGYAVWDSFSRFDRSQVNLIDGNRFASVTSDKLTKFKARLSEESKKLLDQGTDESAAYRILRAIDNDSS